MKPLTIAGIVLGSLGLAYVVHAAAQSPGDKAKVGDTVRIPTTALSIVTSGGATSFPGAQTGDVAAVLITSLDADKVYGSLVSVANSLGTVNVPPGIAISAPGSVAAPRTAVLA